MADELSGRVEGVKDARDLVELATTEDSVEELLRRGLDWLTRVVRFDLATLFLLRDGKLVSVAARGPLANAKVRHHALPLSEFPSLRQALETRRARAFTEEDHSHGDGDPFDGVLDLPPGHACMVVPLCAGERSYGVLTLDRAECETYPQPVVDLVEVYGQMLATALQAAEQRATFERLHRQDHEHAKLLEAQLGGESEGILETSLSTVMRDLARRARQVAETDTPVLITGETGTGKERLARAIHRWSSRADEPFVTLNCAAIPAGLLESELFGHVKGAFTGATKDRAGRFQMAHGGTLLLDEVGELPVELQAKLLRALQEKAFEPVGSDKTVRADVRILAATHVDLQRAIAEKRFREDLYYRLSVFPLRLPPLRERREDLPQLCAFLLEEQARRTGRRGMRVSPAGLARLASYEWPGNLRELANALERATILATGTELGPSSFDITSHAGATSSAPQLEASAVPGGVDATMKPGSVLTLAAVQREHILHVLSLTRGRVYGAGGAAALLGLKPSTLQSRMKKLGIARQEQFVVDEV
ncbi:sigma 54-interacting transcriptional regulator [Myxococcus faecalis]|uniref:sigma 54-interacting transcriptional regulator n=1 Tax=Myxococcus TaxID=32 RepID=UPI001CBF5D0E|nr:MULTISPECIES: sigma 54-interacting transcriptional regulator [unclassified Myxococcus]MBZ4399735.1 sigma 54-interacting transcriptional regulator [Myxococcus sp. AS-1-15]MBZ4409799.1 sigma 54-interacting transcriptional regulator [Myxococcus sp. XM-1-1-1]BDT32215.1 sigma 54-interacting transcriptional regulator [Myxococcus sp. MH1]